MWLPTYSPNLNLIERLWKLVTADELCSEYWWCLHGRYYPTLAPFKQAIIDCLADTSPSYKKKLASLVSLKFQLFKKAAKTSILVSGKYVGLRGRSRTNRGIRGHVAVAGYMDAATTEIHA